MKERRSLREQITTLKRRRDALLNRACTRHERPALLEEVHAINREVAALEKKLGKG